MRRMAIATTRRIALSVASGRFHPGAAHRIAVVNVDALRILSLEILRSLTNEGNRRSSREPLRDGDENLQRASHLGVPCQQGQSRATGGLPQRLPHPAPHDHGRHERQAAYDPAYVRERW